MEVEISFNHGFEGIRARSLWAPGTVQGFCGEDAFLSVMSLPRFPEEVLTRTKKGEIEVRSLVDRGRYVRYNYLHPETGGPMEGGKVKLVLFAESGQAEEYFVIPTKSNRDLLIPAPEKGARKVWDGTHAVDL